MDGVIRKKDKYNMNKNMINTKKNFMILLPTKLNKKVGGQDKSH